MAEMLEAALRLAARGKPVFPCDAKKHPHTSHGFHDATTDERTIRSWWSTWPDANIGLPTGTPLGAFVLDVDPRHGGDVALAALEQEHGPLDATLSARTGGGGLHLYFSMPPTPVKWHAHVCAGLDVQADGKYVVAPPSVTTGPYSWLDPRMAIAAAPTWLLDLAVKKPRERQPATTTTETNGKGYAHAAFERELRAVREAADGTKHTTLNTAAFCLGQLVAAGALDRGGVAAALLDAVTAAGAEDLGAAERTINRALDDGAQEPRAIPPPKSSTKPPPHTDEDAPRPGRSNGVGVHREPGEDDEPGLPPAPAERGYGLTMAELLTSEEDDEDDIAYWCVRGFVPADGPCVVVGEPKSRKTWIAEHLAVSVAAAMPSWLGVPEFAIQPGRVLLLALEDHVKVTRRRIRRLAWGLGVDPRSLDNLRVEPNIIPFRFDKDKDVGRLRGTLDAWRPTLIIADSLTKTHQVDENSVKEMAPVLEAWESICRDYSCALSALHHMNKPNQVNAKARLGNRMRGTTSLFAFVRYLVFVEKLDEEHSAIDVDGNMLYRPDPFTIRITDGETATGKATVQLEHVGPRVAANVGPIKDLILTALAEGPATSGDLAKAISKRKANVLLALRELAAPGVRLVTNDDRKWRLA